MLITDANLLHSDVVGYFGSHDLDLVIKLHLLNTGFKTNGYVRARAGSSVSGSQRNIPSVLNAKNDCLEHYEEV